MSSAFVLAHFPSATSTLYHEMLQDLGVRLATTSVRAVLPAHSCQVRLRRGICRRTTEARSSPSGWNKVGTVVGLSLDGEEKVTARAPNRLGEGGRLRADLISAARTLLERSGTEDAVTLRATAREAGVTAPAIYKHFAGVEDLVRAVIAEAFQEFDQAVRSAMDGVADPAARLEAGCWAYIEFAHRSPATYRILFARSRPSEMPEAGLAAARLFQVLEDILASAGGTRTAEADVSVTAVLLWTGLHGLAALPPHHPRFPWPDRRLLLAELLHTLTSAGSHDRTAPPTP